MTDESISMDALHSQSTVQFARMMKTAYLNYAVETIKDRALPDVRDGLKPVQRRILYTMKEMNLGASAKYRKSARVVGDTMGKYHPHGDGAIYEAMVRLAQDFTMSAPLIDGQGNFGSIDGDGAAAMRYTEVRLTTLAEELMADIEVDTIDWHDNFDNTMPEPDYLPAKFPNLLVNGSEGIAVGMACKIPPHNLGEVCDALNYMAKNWRHRDQITVTDLMKFIPGPDFPTGGILYCKRTESGQEVAVIKQAYSQGQGKVTIQGIIAGEDGNGNPTSDLDNARRLIITEIPYGLNKATLLTQIAEAVRAEKIKGISDLRDESDYEGMHIVVTVTRGYRPNQVLEQLLNRTSLKMTYGIITLALVEGEPEYLSIHDILRLFIEHRLDVIIRRSQFELAKHEARLHLVEGLLTALASINKIIDTIRRSQSTDTARKNLIKNFDLSQEQATAILDMQLRRLAALERKKLQTEKEDLLARINDLKQLLASEEKQLEVIIIETNAVKEKYAVPRRTRILDIEGAGGPITQEDLLKPEGAQIVIATTRGNVQRVPAKGFNLRQSKGMTKRSVDAPLFYVQAEAEDKVILVSNKGRVWFGPIYRIPEKATSKEMGLDKGEAIVKADILRPEAFLTLAASNGKVKRLLLADLNGSEGHWQTVLGGLKATEQVLTAGVTDGSCRVMLFTSQAKAILFAENDVNPQASSSAQGVAAMKLGKGDTLIAGTLIYGGDEARCVFLVSEQGWAKQTPLRQFSIQGRGGQGIQTLKVTKTTGKVAAATVGYEHSTVMVLSSRGRRHNLASNDLPQQTRVQRGQQLIDFGPDDTIEQVVVFENRE